MLHHFVSLVRTVMVEKHVPGRRVDGDWVPGAKTDVEDKMICIPLTPAQLKHLPEGKYTAGDMRFYRKGGPAYSDGDVVTVKGIKYKLGDITDREFDGHYTMYLGKRDYDQSGED